jgi:hypothetical protein
MNKLGLKFHGQVAAIPQGERLQPPLAWWVTICGSVE